MQASVFFEKLSAYISANVTEVAKSTHVTTTFPIAQLDRFKEVNCFIIDSGKTPFPFHPKLHYVDFSICVWTDKMRDSFGSYSINELQKIEHTIHNLLTSLYTLNSEKIIIQYKSTGEIKDTTHNSPCVFRFWDYQTILEI